MAFNLMDSLNRGLRVLGFSGSTPDMMFRHLRSLGHTGSMSDMLSKEGGYKEYSISVACREVPAGDGVSQYITIPLITYMADYVVEADFIFEDEFTNIFGNSGLNSKLSINADGSIAWRAGNSATNEATAPAGTVLSGSGHIKVSRVGSSGVIEVDGVVVFSGTVTTAQCDIQFIGRTASTGFNSPVYNVDFDGTLFYPLDDTFANNPVARETKTSADGVNANFTADTWRVVCL